MSTIETSKDINPAIDSDNANPRIEISENDINLSTENLPEEMFVDVGRRVYDVEGRVEENITDIVRFESAQEILGINDDVIDDVFLPENTNVINRINSGKEIDVQIAVEDLDGDEMI